MFFRSALVEITFSGLGLKEYLDFIEDEGMQPIMAVWAGRLVT